jgi:hypothetical protein
MAWMLSETLLEVSSSSTMKPRIPMPCCHILVADVDFCGATMCDKAAEGLSVQRAGMPEMRWLVDVGMERRRTAL